MLIVAVASKQIMDVNDAAVAFTGYPKAELIRKTLSDLYTPETVALILEGCLPRHMGHGTSAICKIGRGALRTRTGRSEGVELYYQLVQDTSPTVLVKIDRSTSGCAARMRGGVGVPASQLLLSVWTSTSTRQHEYKRNE